MVDLDKIKSELSNLVEKEGYELVDVKLSNGKDGNLLSVIVDRVKPINLDEIISLSEIISKSLDELNPIDSAYTLDISSLGAEKPIKLEKLKEYVGSYVNLHLSTPFKGNNILEGDIESIQDDILRLSFKEKTRTIHADIPLKDIDKARLAIKF